MSPIYLKKLFNTTLVIFLLLISVSTVAQTGREVYKVLGITVEGNKSADVSAIIANSGIRIGDEIEVPGDQTMTAIKRLWSLNIFSDVSIEIEKEVGDGVFLIIKVEEHPRVEGFIVIGNDKISDSNINSKINLMRGQTLKPQDIVRLQKRLSDLYEEDGYLNARITTKTYFFQTADTSSNEIRVYWRNFEDYSDEYIHTYEIKNIGPGNLINRIKDRIYLKILIEENDKVTVRSIAFEGNEFFSDSDLKGAMNEIEEKSWWKFWSGARFDRKKYEADKEEIIKFYRKNGFRDAEIISDSIIYFNDKKDMNLIITVYEGPQYKVRNITWEGNTIWTDEILTERLDFQTGDIFNFEKFNQNLRGNERQNDVAALYLDNGYLTFNVRTTETKVAEDSIDIQIQISENNQFKIGRVEIIGNDKTKDKVIRRELYTVPGDYFNRNALFRSLQQLANLQYFNVERLYQEGIDYRPIDDSTVAITYKVEEKSSDYLNASVGYSGSWGFSGAVGVTLTNFSITEPFSLGGGQILNFSWQFGLGNIYRTFTLGFTEPWFLDTPTLVGFEVFDTRQQYIYDLSQTGGTFRVGRRLRWPDDYFYVQGLFRFVLNNVLEGQGFYTEGKTKQFTSGLTITRRNLDNPIFPSMGSSVTLNAEISGGPILPGDVEYYKLGFSAEWYKRLFNTNRIALYAAADIGYLEELREGTRVQPFDYFYMGGNGLIIATTPLRGYDDRTVGPKNSAGRVIGGRVMTRYTAEIRAALTLEPIPLYILAFAEAGNVFENIKTTDFFELRRSVGFGARLLINPLGLIGFDFGYGYDRKLVDGKDPSWIFHFQFGKGF